jgi:hypothetical protein
MSKLIGVRVTPDQEERLVALQRQLSARNPDSQITLTRAATLTLMKGLDLMVPEVKDAAD